MAKIKQLILLVETVSRLCCDLKLIRPLQVVVCCHAKVWHVDCSSTETIEVSLPPPRVPFTVRVTDANGTMAEELVTEARMGLECEEYLPYGDART